ncbi:MAG: peptidylprolyl isomerase [Candidatus Planktophila sp.]|jgi:peptidyl-prolyl cis-trans isomerase B (cyclophilin B)|tara:strand:- start:2094 stop:2777 length:684 start_codon:yes stop_codon:yes gene_type:complete
MAKTLKVATLVLTLVATTTLISAPAQSAERPTSVPGCAKSKAQGHTPAKVKQPTVAAKKLAKKLTLTTNCGSIVISMYGTKAPITVTSIAALANAGYYNKSLCHRLTTEGIFVLQCGDPTASGGGSPTGWSGYIDENLPKVGAKNYPAGTVAMANSGVKTNGSQFFLVYQDTQLGPNYTIWGKITKGLDLLQKIGEVGAYQMSGTQAMYAGDGFPIQTVEIVKAKAK